jgi:hypothetical protein
VSTPARRPAFLLFGDLPKLAPYMQALGERELDVLVIGGRPGSAMERAACERLADPGEERWPAAELLTTAPDDLDTIIGQVRSWTDRYDVRGVYNGSETLVESAAVVADWLGLPHPGLRAAKVARNKLLQRLYFERWSPRFRLVMPADSGDVVASFDDLPAVIKPLRMYSSINVIPVHDRDQLRAGLERYPRDEPVLVEQRVAGHEISVESLVSRGAPVSVSITDKRTNESEGRFFVEMAHTVPGYELDADLRRKVLEVNGELLERLAFEDGMAHAEYRVTDAGEVFLMEVAARPGGDGILALHHLATGASMESALIAIALGEDVTYPRPQRFARQTYLPHEPGRLRDVTDPAAPEGSAQWLAQSGFWPLPRPGRADEPPAVRSLLVLKERGCALEELNQSSRRAAAFMADAPSPSELDALDQQLAGEIAVETERG